MIKTNFPTNNIEASKYGGFMHSEKFFCKIFDFIESPEKSLDIINDFLLENGYEKVEKLDEELSFENSCFSISKHGYQEQLVLFINRDQDND